MAVSIDPAGVRELAHRLDEASCELDDLVRRAARLGASGEVAGNGAVADWLLGRAARLRTALRIIEDLEAQGVDWARNLGLYGLPSDLERLPNGAGERALGDLEGVLDTLPADATPAERADAVAAFFGTLSPLEQSWLATHSSQTVGNLDGVPNSVRYAANRMTIERTLVQEQARLDAWDPPPAGTDDRVAFTLLRERIERYREFLDVTETSVLDENGRGLTVEVGRSFLAFSAPVWEGTTVTDDGRVAEVLGNLDTATHIGVMVPGITNRIDTFDALVTSGQVLRDQAHDPDSAIIVWLGYDTPEFAEAVATTRAEQGAPGLISLVDGMRRVGGSEVTVFAHSYGTVVTSQALQAGMRPDRVVLMGSPGLGEDIDSAADLGLPQGYPIYAMRAPGDWVSYTESHGDDPVEMDGITRLDTGWGGTEQSEGHSEYYLKDSGSNLNLAALLSGGIPAHVGGDGIVEEQHGGLVVRRVVGALQDDIPPTEVYGLVSDLEPILERMQHGGLSLSDASGPILNVLREHDAEQLLPTIMGTAATAAQEEGARYVGGTVLDTAADALDTAASRVGGWVDGVRGPIGAGIDWVQAGGDAGAAALQGLHRSTTDALQDGGNTLVDGGQVAERAMVDAGQTGLNRFIDTWQGLPLGPIGPVGPAVRLPASWVDGAQAGLNRMIDGQQDLGDAVTDAAQDGANWLTDKGQDALDAAVDSGRAGLGAVVDGGQDFVGNAVDGVQDRASDAVDGTRDTLEGWADELFGG